MSMGKCIRFPLINWTAHPVQRTVLTAMIVLLAKRPVKTLISMKVHVTLLIQRPVRFVYLMEWGTQQFIFGTVSFLDAPSARHTTVVRVRCSQPQSLAIQASFSTSTRIQAMLTRIFIQ